MSDDAEEDSGSDGNDKILEVRDGNGNTLLELENVLDVSVEDSEASWVIEIKLEGDTSTSIDKEKPVFITEEGDIDEEQ